jgi:hypothetical protein
MVKESLNLNNLIPRSKVTTNARVEGNRGLFILAAQIPPHVVIRG